MMHTSSLPMSMPNSRALVETTVVTDPSRSPFSMARNTFASRKKLVSVVDYGLLNFAAMGLNSGSTSFVLPGEPVSSAVAQFFSGVFCVLAMIAMFSF